MFFWPTRRDVGRVFALGEVGMRRRARTKQKLRNSCFGLVWNILDGAPSSWACVFVLIVCGN